ncbi:hypothetical protein [Novipirellula rosea]|uniref:DUF4199 domain-containing protein n=1 Tax=Novipirellula rosea TaxID=1031540 RepID=A0ABP8NNS7_9BACT
MIHQLKWVVAGVIGGAVGAWAWAAITYWTHHEVGWIALGIGVLVGMAVRMAAGNIRGWAPGITAAIFSFLAIIGGKYVGTKLLFDLELLNLTNDVRVTDEEMAVVQAMKIIQERDVAGEPVNWPPGQSATTAKQLSDFPVDVATEARTRWNSTPPGEHFNQKKARKEELRSKIRANADDLRMAAFTQSFSPVYGLFFLLAILSAFKIASGLAIKD